MKTYIRRQQHKKKIIHQNIKQKEPPQKYRLGTISNTKLLEVDIKGYIDRPYFRLGNRPAITSIPELED